MKFKSHISVAALVVVTGTLVLAQSRKNDQPEADALSCAQAGTPGPQHARLIENVGVWQGKCNMWMTPGAEPVASEFTTTITSVMDGRFTKCEVKGEIP